MLKSYSTKTKVPSCSWGWGVGVVGVVGGVYAAVRVAQPHCRLSDITARQPVWPSCRGRWVVLPMLLAALFIPPAPRVRLLFRHWRRQTAAVDNHRPHHRFSFLLSCLESSDWWLRGCDCMLFQARWQAQSGGGEACVFAIIVVIFLSVWFKINARLLWSPSAFAPCLDVFKHGSAVGLFI